MKNIRSLEKSELLQCTRDLVALERRTTLELVEHLREIDRRLLFLELGYSSLFEFSVKHLGLSEGSAQRRVSAMKLIRDVPEAQVKLESGEITLSNASQVQAVFRSTKMSVEEKKETLNKISGMTQRECQSTLLSLVPEAAPKLMERERKVSEAHFELKLVVSKELHDQIEELKLLLSHTLQNSGNSELLKFLVGEELKRQKKKRGLSACGASLDVGPEESPQSSRGDITAAPVQSKVLRSTRFSRMKPAIKHSETKSAATRSETKPVRKHISNGIRRQIWKRAEGRCEATDLAGRCASRYRLELDHIVPHAIGGTDGLENLRLFCRAHNLKHSVENYGAEVVDRYR
jgi:5-methylcytosine-specific restriction endonuclease McrA